MARMIRNQPVFSCHRARAENRSPHSPSRTRRCSRTTRSSRTSIGQRRRSNAPRTAVARALPCTSRQSLLLRGSRRPTRLRTLRTQAVTRLGKYDEMTRRELVCRDTRRLRRRHRIPFADEQERRRDKSHRLVEAALISPKQAMRPNARRILNREPHPPLHWGQSS